MDEDYWDEVFGSTTTTTRRSRTSRRSTSTNKQNSDRESVIQRYRTMQVRVQDQQGNYHLVRKKVR
jgi:hypothetical protein